MMNAIEVFIGGLGRLKARPRLRLYFFVAIRPFLKRARPSDRGIYIFSFNFLLYNFNFYCPHFSSIIFITLFNKLIYIHYLKITFFNSLSIHCRNFIKEWKEQKCTMLTRTEGLLKRKVKLKQKLSFSPQSHYFSLPPLSLSFFLLSSLLLKLNTVSLLALET